MSGRGADAIMQARAPSEPEGPPALTVSYLTLRAAVGVIGVGLPIVLPIGCLALSGVGLQPTLSDYYATVMRDVLVGALCAVGLFLWSYAPYQDDELPGKLAAVLAVLVALFPSPSPVHWIHLTHLVAATLLFVTLAYFSLFLFTKTHADRRPTARKRARNRVYRVAGCLMLASISFAAACRLTPLGRALESIEPVFWAEATALWAFGWSWVTKGQVILKDAGGS